MDTFSTHHNRLGAQWIGSSVLPIVFIAVSTVHTEVSSVTVLAGWAVVILFALEK